MTAMKIKSAIFCVFLTLTFAGCSEEKETDLAMEMGAQKAIHEIDILINQGKIDEATAKLKELETNYGHTKNYAQAKGRLLNAGISTQSPETVFTSKSLIELENTVLAFYKQAKRWPDPGQVRKPLDAWDNETYWVLGGKNSSYDAIFVSAGPDGIPGSGDEVIVVYVIPGSAKDAKKEKRKEAQEGKDTMADTKSTKGKAGVDIKAKKKARTIKVMTLDDLKSMEKSADTPPEDMISLKDLASAGEASKKAGQPRQGETIMSLEELKEKL